MTLNYADHQAFGGLNQLGLDGKWHGANYKLHMPALSLEYICTNLRNNLATVLSVHTYRNVSWIELGSRCSPS